MKKYLLSVLLVFTTIFSYADDGFGEGTSGCISYNAQTNRLTLKATYEYYSDWLTWVSGSNTFAYVKPLGSSIFVGPFPSTSCSPYTCEYDISSLIGTITLPGCYDFFIVTDKTAPGYIPKTNGNPFVGTDWDVLTSSGWTRFETSDYVPFGVPGAAIQNGCDCPEDSDPLTAVPCDASFDFTMSYFTPDPPPFTPKLHYGDILAHNFIPDATYTYDYGNGNITGSPISSNYSPGNYTVCLKAERINGEECQTCMDICVADDVVTRDNTGAFPASCDLEFKFVATYSPSLIPFTPPTVRGDIFVTSWHPGSTYLYDFGNGTTSSGPISCFYPTAGIYKVCVTETFGHPGTTCKTCMDICVGATQIIVPFAKKTDGNDFISSKGDNQISIYPNPASSKTELKIGMSKQENVSVQVIDMTGKKVADIFNGTMNEGSQTLTINTENLASGLYQVKMMIGNKVTTQKLSVVK